MTNEYSEWVPREEYDADIKEASHFNFRMGAAFGGFIILCIWIIYALQ